MLDILRLRTIFIFFVMDFFRSKPEKGYLTVSVYNLEPSVTRENLEKFFTDIAPDCEPVIKPFVQDRGKKATTVIFKGKSRKQCEDVARDMQGRPLVDDT